MEQKIRDWIARDPLGYGYLLDFYQRGARVCYFSGEGLALKNDSIDICYAGGSVPLEVEEMRSSLLLLTDDKAAKDALMERGDYMVWDEFYQAVWQRELPEVRLPAGVTLRPLTPDDLEFVVANYHNPGAYETHIRGRLAEGMIGAEVNGELAGFVGVHQEGCMGLLEVVPKFRRMGLAEALEAAIIRQQVGRGRFPYAHIRTGNEASIALQKKMGMEFLERKVYWLFPD